MIRVNTNYIPKDDKSIFMVSGGIDSLAATHWLKFKCYKKFDVIHFNHNCQPINLRMDLSVRKFCEDFDIGGFFFKNNEQTDYSENALREWRLSKLEWIGGDLNYLTGHHLGDAVENYLMNCFHGTPEYLPISWKTEFSNYIINHPFLHTTKQDFIDYAEENDLMKYVVEDPTNKETTQKRNWIRNEIVPQLEERQMGIETIVRKKFYLN